MHNEVQHPELTISSPIAIYKKVNFAPDPDDETEEGSDSAGGAVG